MGGGWAGDGVIGTAVATRRIKPAALLLGLASRQRVQVCTDDEPTYLALAPEDH
jgi:hypothetical protein